MVASALYGACFLFLKFENHRRSSSGNNWRQSIDYYAELE